jgi:hypothetical protein
MGKAVGRPPIYHIKIGHDLNRVTKFMLLGATMPQLADYLEVGLSTVKKWMNEFPEFSAAVNKGRKEADANVAHGFYKSAAGHEIVEEKIFQYQGQIVRTNTTKYFPPNGTDAANWLRLRDPERWKEKDTKDDAPPVIAKVIFGVPGFDLPEQQPKEAE